MRCSQPQRPNNARGQEERGLFSRLKQIYRYLFATGGREARREARREERRPGIRSVSSYKRSSTLKL